MTDHSSTGRCERCNAPFERTTPTKRYCAEACRKAAERRRNYHRRYKPAQPERRTCTQCCADFTTNGGKRRLCYHCNPGGRPAPTGHYKTALRKPYRRGSTTKAGRAQAVGNRIKAIRAAAAASPDNTVHYLCEYCGTEFPYTFTSSRGLKHRACSKSCANALHHGSKFVDRNERTLCNCGNDIPRWTPQGTERKYCDTCRDNNVGQREWVKQNPDKARAHWRKRIERQWLNGGTCPIPLTHPSREEERKAKARDYFHDYYHVRGNKEPYYRSSYKRRALLKTNGPIDNIDRIAVFECDNWKCRACGTTTTTDVHRSHHKRAILGHINAIAAGGTHTWDNVCCLCFPCNAKDGVNQIPIQTSMLDNAA